MSFRFRFVLVIALVARVAHASGKAPCETQIDDAWNRVFARSTGWTGGDVAGTVDLLDGRTLWVFGDTWFGDVKEGRHAAGSKLVNNSIAVHLRTPAGVPPAVDKVQFIGGVSDANNPPLAWLTPESAAAAEEMQRTWYWPNGGGAVVPKGDGSGQKLVIFLFHVGKRNDIKSVWNFKVIGSAMAVVENVARPPAEWRPRVISIPHAGVRNTAVTDPDDRVTNWGASACLDDKSQSLYLYGVRPAVPAGRQLVLARVPARSVDDFPQWRFYAGNGAWSHDANNCVPIADNVASELSVSKRVDPQGKMTLVMVHSEPLFGSRIVTRTAPQFEGPWNPPRAIYTVPELSRNKTYFTYAAKGHAHLSRPGELLVSYIVNSHDFGAMVKDASIYRPKFARVPLSRILSVR